MFILWSFISFIFFEKRSFLSRHAANALQKLLAQIRSLSKLQILNLSDNQLDTGGALPIELCDIVNLRELYLDGNANFEFSSRTLWSLFSSIIS